MMNLNTLFDDLEPFGPAGSQDERRAQVVRLACVFAQQAFDETGRCVLSDPPPPTRETMWLCFGLLNGEKADRVLANAILGRLEMEFHIHARSKEEEEAAGEFDIFITNHTVQLLRLHREKLDPPVLEKMERWGRVALRDYNGDRQSDYQFHGYNDNMPSKATLGLILGGEYFDDQAAVEHGLWNLRQLRDLLSRRGTLSEYSSPTYSALSLANLTEIEALAGSEDARELARQCVERIWAEFLGRFHPPTGILSGPYSRAYSTDSIGHLTFAGTVFWLAFGNTAILNPVEELRQIPPRVVIAEGNDLTRVVGMAAWLAAVTYQPPAPLVEWMRQRSYPYRIRTITERGSGGEKFAPGEILCTTYQEEDFALGTAEGETWEQAEPFSLAYRRQAPATDVAHIRTAQTRVLINDQRPGEVEGAECGPYRGEAVFLHDHGLTHTIQQDRVAMVLARPVLRLAGQPITSLRYSVILSTHFGEIEEVSLVDDHVFMKDGPIYLALRPLNATDWGRKDAVRIEPVNKYLEISFFNYEGEERTFSEEELSRTLNGMIAVVGLSKEKSFDEFKNEVGNGELLDYYTSEARTVRYRLGDTTLGMNHAGLPDRVRFATINGRPISRPIWEADGMPPERLPFLSGDTEGNSFEFPYEHLRVIWDPERPWQIASRGVRSE